ncbi:Lysophospholipid transporter lplT [Salmonella enterica subsp. enterica]|uniref:Lysophospholipid transporter lplT n=1 Tax=Salmonella enterica I TaxID=59201 RepID=A0A379VL41_SALET|nr:Lysophospholipid transporter lplT [Salmonella enterica subsp. enterica]
MKANGLMEASTIAAILLGSVAGGVLADWHVIAALVACALAYAGAVARTCYPEACGGASRTILAVVDDDA